MLSREINLQNFLLRNGLTNFSQIARCSSPHPWRILLFIELLFLSCNLCMKKFFNFSSYIHFLWPDPASIYLFKVSNKNTRKMCEIWPKWTIKTPERCHFYFHVFFYKFEPIWHLFPVFLLMTLNKYLLAGYIFERNYYKTVSAYS